MDTRGGHTCEMTAEIGCRPRVSGHSLPPAPLEMLGTVLALRCMAVDTFTWFMSSARSTVSSSCSNDWHEHIAAVATCVVALSSSFADGEELGALDFLYLENHYVPRSALKMKFEANDGRGMEEGWRSRVE